MHSKKQARRRGVLAMELLLVLPILMAFLLASIEFSLLLSARQQVAGAAREAARIAAWGGGESDVRAILDRCLGNKDVRFNLTTTRSDGSPLESGDPVGVTVSVPTSRFVPELLGFIGFSLRGTNVVAKAVMVRE